MNHDVVTTKTTLQVSLGDRSYPIVIGASLLTDVANLVPFLPSKRVALVTNETLYPLYGEALASALRRQAIDVLPVCLPDGERFKDWPALNKIFDALLEHSCDRNTTLIALGGGVIGDIAGFAAATYQRDERGIAVAGMFQQCIKNLIQRGPVFETLAIWQANRQYIDGVSPQRAGECSAI